MPKQTNYLTYATRWLAHLKTLLAEERLEEAEYCRFIVAHFVNAALETHCD